MVVALLVACRTISEMQATAFDVFWDCPVCVWSVVQWSVGRWTLSLCAAGALQLAVRAVSFHALIDQIIHLENWPERVCAAPWWVALCKLLISVALSFVNLTLYSYTGSGIYSPRQWKLVYISALNSFIYLPNFYPKRDNIGIALMWRGHLNIFSHQTSGRNSKD